MTSSRHIPGYLGRVLTVEQVDVGTCFQVLPGVLVTAWHVVDLLNTEPLVALSGEGGDPVVARVAGVDPLHDLAVLHTDGPLPSCVDGLFATDDVEPGSPVVVTGLVGMHDIDSRHVDAPGRWVGGATRDEQVALGCLSARRVVSGMAGAPVRRLADDRVVGVISARYNGADGWSGNPVWVARIEDLEPLLSRRVMVEHDRRLDEPIDLVLAVSASTVRLTGPDVDVSAPRESVSYDLADTSLPALVTDELARVLCRAEDERRRVLIGIAASDLYDVRWEELLTPGGDQPLTLHPLVTMYRRHDAAVVRAIPGPLRVVVAIAAPENGGALLDYERELRNVVAAVRSARQNEADVRVVPFATTAAIRTALEERPAHILHISCHGEPGRLVFEDEEGLERRLTADELVDEAIPTGVMPPVVALSACYTSGTPSFAARLIERGASVVIGTRRSVTDRYATSLFARVYQELAQDREPDVVGAVARARRVVQRQLPKCEEWSAVTVLAGAGAIRVFDPAVVEEVPVPSRRLAAGLLPRDVGDFVGRRREQRRVPVRLAEPGVSGVVLHGIGGIGKTTLATELMLRIDPPTAVVLSGELSVDVVFAEVAGALRQQGTEHAEDPSETWQARFAALRAEILDRVPLLLVLDNFEDNLTDDRRVRDHALRGLLAEWARDPGRSRMLVTTRFTFSLPDGAHDHLSFEPVGPMSQAETFKLIWSLPALDRLSEAELGLIWRLVGGHPRALEYVDALLNGGKARFDDVTARLTTALETAHGSVPRTFDAAMADAITMVADEVLLGQLVARVVESSHAERLLLNASVYREPVERLALAIQFVEQEVSVPLDVDQIVDQVAATGLLAVDPRASAVFVHRWTTTEVHPYWRDLSRAGTVFVHRWTATELHRYWRGLSRTEELRLAHQGAARYWLSRSGVLPAESYTNDVYDIHDLLEARHHYIAAGNIDDAGHVTELLSARLHITGAWDHESALLHDSLTRLSGSPLRPLFLKRLGRIAHQRGDLAEAERRYSAALASVQELDDTYETAQMHEAMGRLAQDRNDLSRAEHHYKQAITIVSALGREEDLASGYYNLGMLAHMRDDLGDAKDYYLRARTIFEKSRNWQNLASVHGELGRIALTQGDLAQAERDLDQSLTLCKRIGYELGTAASWSQLGDVAMARGQFHAALDLHLKAHSARASLGVPELAYNVRQLARLRGLSGREAFVDMAKGRLHPEDLSELMRTLDFVDRRTPGEGGQ